MAQWSSNHIHNIIRQFCGRKWVSNILMCYHSLLVWGRARGGGGILWSLKIGGLSRRGEKTWFCKYRARQMMKLCVLVRLSRSHYTGFTESGISMGLMWACFRVWYPNGFFFYNFGIRMGPNFSLVRHTPTHYQGKNPRSYLFTCITWNKAYRMLSCPLPCFKGIFWVVLLTLEQLYDCRCASEGQSVKKRKGRHWWYNGDPQRRHLIMLQYDAVSPCSYDNLDQIGWLFMFSKLWTSAIHHLSRG